MTTFGTVIAIGGREDKEGERAILAEVVRRVGHGRLVVTAIASEEPRELLQDYRTIFHSLGAKEIGLLDIQSRHETTDEKNLSIFEGATGIFFTGGDQLRITSQIADTPIYHKLKDVYKAGGVIAGTSAGASVMCATMLTAGSGGGSPKAGGVKMAPGLGLIENVIIDQHFAERGRMGRLLCAIAENPGMLGIGIDEDTAIIVEGGTRFTVMGRGAVYVIDGTELSYSNVAEEMPNETLSLHNVKLHVLSGGDSYELTPRQPMQPISTATKGKVAVLSEVSAEGEVKSHPAGKGKRVRKVLKRKR